MRYVDETIWYDVLWDILIDCYGTVGWEILIKPVKHFYQTFWSDFFNKHFYEHCDETFDEKSNSLAQRKSLPFTGSKISSNKKC